MAYVTGTASTMLDFVTALLNFGTANGWTQDQLGTDGLFGVAAMHKNDVYVQFFWNAATPQSLVMTQSLGFNVAASPGQHPDDSGSPENITSTNTFLQNKRGFRNIGNGPYVAYHFFSDPGGPQQYIHTVLEFAPGVFRHCGFGELRKFGDWVGGEYCYGTQTGLRLFTSGSNGNSILLDGSYNGSGASSNDPTDGSQSRATMHIEGLPGQATGGKWGIFTRSTANPDDRSGTPRQRLVGGYKGGPLAHAFGGYASNLANGFVPMLPVQVWAYDSVPSVPVVRFLGVMPHVRQTNTKAFNPGDEFSVSAETWKIFPAVRKQNTGASEESGNLGVAYRKIE